MVQPWLRFHIPLIEPDMQISRIRLSDKTGMPSPTARRAQAQLGVRAQVPVKVRERIGPALASPNFVLDADDWRNRTAV